MKKIGTWFMHLSKIVRVGLVVAALSVVGAAGASSSTLPQSEKQDFVLGSQTSSPQTNAAQTPKPVETMEDLEITSPVPFESKTVESLSLERGTSRVTTKGVEGTKTQIWEVKYLDGIETGRKLKSESTTTPPVTEITTIGTKVALDCPNGTYINSVGNMVCSPYESASAPAGATAQCVDGTYSFSQSRRGTCSHHGGVARWL